MRRRVCFDPAVHGRGVPHAAASVRAETALVAADAFGRGNGGADAFDRTGLDGRWARPLGEPVGARRPELVARRAAGLGRPGPRGVGGDAGGPCRPPRAKRRGVARPQLRRVRRPALGGGGGAPRRLRPPRRPSGSGASPRARRRSALRPVSPLPFACPSVVVASRDDPTCAFLRAPRGSQKRGARPSSTWGGSRAPQHGLRSRPLAGRPCPARGPHPEHGVTGRPEEAGLWAAAASAAAETFMGGTSASRPLPQELGPVGEAARRGLAPGGLPDRQSSCIRSPLNTCSDDPQTARRVRTGDQIEQSSHLAWNTLCEARRRKMGRPVQDSIAEAAMDVSPPDS